MAIPIGLKTPDRGPSPLPGSHDLVRQRLHVRIREDVLEEVPYTLAALPVSYRDVAAPPQQFEHPPRVLAVVPTAGAVSPGITRAIAIHC